MLHQSYCQGPSNSHLDLASLASERHGHGTRGVGPRDKGLVPIGSCARTCPTDQLAVEAEDSFDRQLLGCPPRVLSAPSAQASGVLLTVLSRPTPLSIVLWTWARAALLSGLASRSPLLDELRDAPAAVSTNEGGDSSRLEHSRWKRDHRLGRVTVLYTHRI